jgi:type I restriction enzyme S subunit
MSRLKAWEGAIALVPEHFDGWFVSPEFPTFDIDVERVVPAFLETLLTSERFWSKLAGASKGMGARKERVSAERLLEKRIQVPDLAEQRVRAAVAAGIGQAQHRIADRSQVASALVPSLLNQIFGELR